MALTPEEVQHYTTAAAALTSTQVEVLSRGVYNYNSSGSVGGSSNGGSVGGGSNGVGSSDSSGRRASVGGTSVSMDNSTSKVSNNRRKSTGTSATVSTEGNDDNVDSTYWSTDVDAATAAAIAAVASTGANTSTSPSGGDGGAKRGRGRPKKIVM